MKFALFLVVFSVCLHFNGISQQPKYTPKKFVNYFDTSEFKIINPKGDGMISTYILTEMEIWDTDDYNTTAVKGGGLSLINIRGMQTNGKRNGIFTTYLIDSADHSWRYKVYEQTYANDKLNGEWRVFNLKGTLILIHNYKDDSLNGISRTFWIDGKTIFGETEYFNGRNKFIEREYSKTGKLIAEVSVLNGKENGLSKQYYEDGSINREGEFSDGKLNGSFKYYYPGGKLWIEQVFKAGKPWTIIGNYDKNGKPREKGTLNNGNGTIYLYNDDDTVRAIETYVNGVEQNK